MLAIGVGVVVMLYVDIPTIVTIRQWSIDTGNWLPLLYFFAYVTLTQFPVPHTVLILASGVLFGPVPGFLLAIITTTISALLSLRIVRFLGHDRIRTHLTNRRLLNLDHRLEQRGWLTVLSLRMIAGVPFSFLSCACGLSLIRIVSYITATALGSVPSMLAVVLLDDTLSVGFDMCFAAVTGILLVLSLLGLLADVKFPVVTGSSKR